MASPKLLTEIDDLYRDEHYYLSAEDECYFLFEYIAGGGYGISSENQLVFNLKKKMDRRGLPDWHYKDLAIRQSAHGLSGAADANWYKGAVVVPIPPSKLADHPEHDDRMTQVAKLLCRTTGATCLELLMQLHSTETFHESKRRRNPDEIAANYRVNEAFATSVPHRILLLDDVIASGSHFVAGKRVLGASFPYATVVGLFVARRSSWDDLSTDPD